MTAKDQPITSNPRCQTLGWFLVCFLALSFVPVFATTSTQNTPPKFCINGICSANGTEIMLHKANQAFVIKNFATGITINQIKIGIQESQVCTKLLQTNTTTDCIPYDKLKIFDNTNPVLAGQWINATFYHREQPRVTSHYLFTNNTAYVMVDPDPSYSLLAKMIIVQSKNFTWVNATDKSNGGLQLVTHVNRYVEGCKSATVAPNLFVINDTVNYLLSGCTKTGFNDTVVSYQKEIPFSFNNPYSTLHYQNFTKHIKSIGGMGNCITHQCNYTNIYKKPGW